MITRSLTPFGGGNPGSSGATEKRHSSDRYGAKGAAGRWFARSRFAFRYRDKLACFFAFTAASGKKDVECQSTQHLYIYSMIRTLLPTLRRMNDSRRLWSAATHSLLTTESHKAHPRTVPSPAWNIFTDVR